MRFRKRFDTVIETDSEVFADLIFRGNRPGAVATKDYDTGVCRVAHAKRLMILAEWAEKARVSWTDIEAIIRKGMITRLTLDKMIIEALPLTGQEGI
jgi:hypothetical protein